MLGMFSTRRIDDSQLTCNSGHISPAAGSSVEAPKFQRHRNECVGLFAIHLVLEERVPDIFHHSGHSQDVALTFLVSLDTETVAEHDAIIPNQPESASRKSARSWVGVDPDHPLKKLRPSRVLNVTPRCVVAVLF